MNPIKALARWVLREEIAEIHHKARICCEANEENYNESLSEIWEENQHYRHRLKNLKAERRIRAPKLP